MSGMPGRHLRHTPEGRRPGSYSTDGRRINGALWFAALMFATLVGCTIWLSSGEPPSGPQEPLLSETPR